MRIPRLLFVAILFPLALPAQEKSLATLIQDQENALRRLELFARKLERLGERLGREGQHYAAGLLRKAYAHLLAARVRERMEDVRRRLEAEQLFEAQALEQQVLKDLEESLRILLDRRSLEKLEGKLRAVAEALKRLEGIRAEEERLARATRQVRDPQARQVRAAYARELEALRQEEEALLRANPALPPETKGARTRLSLELEALARAEAAEAQRLREAARGERALRGAGEELVQALARYERALTNLGARPEDPARGEALREARRQVDTAYQALAEQVPEAALLREALEEAGRRSEAALEAGKAGQAAQARREAQAARRALARVRAGLRGLRREAARRRGEALRRQAALRQRIEALEAKVGQARAPAETVSGIKEAKDRAGAAEKALAEGRTAAGAQDAAAARKALARARAALERAEAARRAERAPRLQEQARQQAELARKTRQTARRLEPASPESARATQEAAAQMEQAAQDLQQGRAERARARQGEAVRRLERARKDLELSGPVAPEEEKARERLALWQEKLRREAEALRQEVRRRLGAGTDPSPSLGRAERSMERARDALRRGQWDQALERQAEAQAALRAAARELKKRERNYVELAQEETIFRVGQMLRDVLKEQEEINRLSALEAHNLPARGRVRRSVRKAFARLAVREGRAKAVVDRVTERLQQERAAVFLFLLRQISEDMGRIRDHLGRRPRPRYDDLTRLLQGDVVRNLKRLVAALEEEARRREAARRERRNRQDSGEEPRGRPRLIPPAAELVLLKKYELQVRERTLALRETVKKLGAVPPQVRELMTRLAHQQGSVRAVLREFMKAMNIQ